MTRPGAGKPDAQTGPDVRLTRWSDEDRVALQRLMEALKKVAVSVAQSQEASPEPFGTMPARGPDSPTDAEKARALYQQRRNRDAAFGRFGAVFSEPAWDILLDLFIAHEDGVSRSTADLIARHVAPANGRRWLLVLSESGLAHRWTAPKSGQEMIGITPTAIELMLRYLDGV
ncbi:hypothetical protein [Sphingomonas sp. Leaf343]|uniref:hypothetical protein n=1 Tax=Sphingomonas sp. Leaf343 TaxID=1736345 RepID=UPI0012E1C180|nr:hypothetical protein [Sphingomonas sp. Leaf343]